MDITLILSEHQIKDFEVAEMIYAYLVEYGDSTDYSLMDDLYNFYLKGDVT